MKKEQFNSYLIVVAGALGCLVLTACGKKDGASSSLAAIQVQGSDTMVNVAQGWAEAYNKTNPAVSIEVGGGGSGVGIAALINGTIDIATASRDMKPGEKSKAKTVTGQEPKEYIVGYDCLAVYVHRDNPLEQITLEQLEAIFAETGTTTRWSDLGVTVPGCESSEIIRVSRQSSSGTYEFFREHVLENKDFKLGSRDMNGSKEVVELVGSTPCAIGYSGMGYATDQVKMLKISSEGGQPVAPTVDNAQDKSYPIARPLFLYTAGEPKGEVQEFLNWVLSDAGQEIVAETGYVPVPSGERATVN